MSHASGPGEVTNATIGPVAARVLAVIGGVVVLAAIVAYGWLIAQAISDPAVLTTLNSDLHRTSGRTGPHNTSTLITIEALSILGFLLGVFCLGLADIARRRTTPSTYTRVDSYVAGSGFQYPVRVIGWGWQLFWIILLIVGWALSYAIPNTLGLLVPGAEGYDQFLMLLIFPLMLTSAACLATIGSLVKKLSYHRQLSRHPGHPTTPKRGALRTFLFLWRGDLGLAAIGGLLAGVSIWPATTGYAIVAFGFVFCGVLFVIAGLIMGQQFWRTGEQLAVVTVSRPPANGALYQ